MSGKFENPNLTEIVAISTDTQFKKIVVDYVGKAMKKEDVSVEDIVEVFTKEFPEFVLALAEENWIRGYEQALVDLEAVDGKADD